METMTKNKCSRHIVWHGKVSIVEADSHSYAWSGKMPCTGMYRCVYCGQVEDSSTFNGKKGSKFIPRSQVGGM